MKQKELIRYLQGHKCELLREEGKHSWWKNSQTGAYSSVPRHSEIVDVLADKICKDLKIPGIKEKNNR